ncbi:9307_t:CDS:1, partial [Ambispora gerdemannii]
MNGMDVADQLRSYYNTQQTTRRNWMPLFFWLLDTTIINTYQIIRTLGSTQEHKEFRHELVWDLIDFANDPDKVQLRNNSEKETKSTKEIKRPKVTKHFELSDQWLIPGNHFAEWREQREVCQWCAWQAKKKELNMSCKSPNRNQL